MSDKQNQHLFNEGHKRETRKSYQLFINELMDSKEDEDGKVEDNVAKESATSGTGEESMDADDSSRRRSKRTPIPKRNFKLIDNYDEPSKKKAKTDDNNDESVLRGSSSKKSKGSKRQSLKKGVEVDVPIGPPETVEDEKDKEEIEDPTPRKSSRAPKPKTFKDSITIPYKKQPKEVKQEPLDEDVFISTTEAVKQRRKANTNDDAADVPNASKRSGRRKSVPSQKIREQTETETSPKKSKRKSVEDIAPAENLTSGNNDIQTKASPKKRQSGKSSETNSKVKKPRRSEPEEIVIKLEDTTQDDVTSSGKKNQYESFVTAKTKPNDNHTKPSPKKRQSKKSSETTAEVNETERSEPDEIIIKLEENLQDDDPSTEKNNYYESFVTTESKPEMDDSIEEISSTATAPLVEDESLTEPELKEKIKKGTKKKEVKKQKLIVSFKKKDKAKSIDTVAESSIDNVEEVAKEIEQPSSLQEDNTLTEVDIQKGKTKQKKVKKKAKKKLDEKTQKVIDVKSFPVEDDVISKVKKKKIYKKRNGQKVLVRIIKNHCNKSGEIVKTETVLVDNIPVNDLDDSVSDVKTPTGTPDGLETTIDSVVDQSDDDIGCKENTDMQLDESVPLIDGSAPVDEEYVPDDEKSKQKKKKDGAKKKIEMKKKAAKSAKKASRPANKNVTIGGKVVGKTTKGMKKTGTASLEAICDTPLPGGKTTLEMVDTPQHQTEPKNPYNSFCRKYRPLIVQQFPKADFSEISRRLGALWHSASQAEKQEHRSRFKDISNKTRSKLNKLKTTSPSNWTESEMRFVKNAITVEKENFVIPTYNIAQLKPVDFAAHLQLLGESLSSIAEALGQQSSMTVHGAMSVLLDSMLCSFAPLLFMTSLVPEMKCIPDEQQARILDNVGYVLPGL